MTAVFLELGKLALLAGFAFPWFVGWATLMERFGGEGCLCRRHAWHPDCPVHGRKEHA